MPHALHIEDRSQALFAGLVSRCYQDSSSTAEKIAQPADSWPEAVATGLCGDDDTSRERTPLKLLQKRLADAWEDLERKSYLSDDVELGRDATADEEAIFNAASDAADEAFGAMLRWEPKSSRELAAKIAAVDHSIANDLTVARAVLKAIREDSARLSALDSIGSGAGKAERPGAFLTWEHDRETYLSRAEGQEDAVADPNHDAAMALHGQILREPCATPHEAAVKLRAIMHMGVGVRALGMTANDELALGQVRSFLEDWSREEQPAELRGAAERLLSPTIEMLAPNATADAGRLLHREA